MIISLTHQLAFLCMPKCASTSIEKALETHADIHIGGRPGLKHMNAREYHRIIRPLVQRKAPDLNIETFCVMRDPLEWANSWYRYRSRRELRDPGHPMHRNYTGEMSFADFVAAMLGDEPPSFAAIGSQAGFICLADGSVGIDRIFDFNRLDGVAQYLQDKLGRRVRLRRMNRSPARPGDLEAGLEARFRDRFSRDFQLYGSVQ